MRQPERAMERAERAIRLSPFDALNYRAYLALAVAHFYEERYNEAAEAARSVIAINPSFSFGYALLAAALMRLGHVDAARMNARSVLEHQPSFTIRGFAAAAEFDPAVFKPLADAWREVGLPQ
jgi:tetratricopeptide (TPR) repeat protein